MSDAGRRLAAFERLELADPRWHDFVDAHPDAQPVHLPQWAALIGDCYGLRPFVLASLGTDGEILAGAPVIEVGGRLRSRGWVSLPFTDYCPPLVARDVGGDLTAALDHARRDAKVASLELRAELPGGPALAAVGHRHVLELAADAAEVFKGFHHSQVQRAIRRAERDAVLEVRVASSEAELSHVYYALHLETRQRLGAPIQPRRFFRLLWQRMLEPGHGFLLLAYSGGEAVAGAVYLQSPRTLLYKYGASQSEAWRLRPNHLLMWTAIQRACAEGRRTLDFGRTEIAHESLAAFKRSWGAEELDLIYTRLRDGGPVAAPISSHALLAATIRRSPPALCRVLGELLYRFAA